jgi:hypothetical protein
MPLMITAWRGKVVVATLLLTTHDDIDVQTVDLDTTIITTVPIGALRGCRKGRRLGVWLEEDVHRESDNEEEEEEDQEEEEPLND